MLKWAAVMLLYTGDVIYNQFGFSCERIQPGEESFRAVGKLGTRDGFEHTEHADLLSINGEARLSGFIALIMSDL